MWNQCNTRTSVFFFKDYTNWIKLDINWIMNSSMIFFDWKKRLGQSYEEMKRTVNRDSYNATPLVVQISFFCMKETQEPQPHPRVALQGETTPHLDPMSMKSPRLSVLLSSLKGISFIGLLYTSSTWKYFGICDIHFSSTGPPRKMFLDFKKETLPCQYSYDICWLQCSVPRIVILDIFR